MVATLPGRTQGLGLIAKPLLADLHLTPGRLAMMNLVTTLAGSTFALLAGFAIDRLGARKTTALTAVLLAAATAAMAGASGATALFVTLLLTRGLGQSALSVGSLAIVGKWFGATASRPMGYYSLALGLGFVAAFLAVQAAAETWGWRAAWLGVGIGVLVVGVATALFARDGTSTRQEPASVEGATTGEALRTPAFWAWGIASAAYLFVSSGISLFGELLLNERGFGAGTFRTSLAVTALLGIAANFAGGLLGAKWPLPRLLALSSAALVPCLVAFPYLKSESGVIVWSAGMGIAGGIVTVVFFAIWSRYFGRRNLGKIQGTAQAMTVVASALGPLAFAECAERTGSYAPLFLYLAPVFAVLAVLCLVVPAPSQSVTMKG
jgi:MFS family permease